MILLFTDNLPGYFPRLAQFHQRMAKSGDRYVQEIHVAAAARRGAGRIVLFRTIQTESRWRKFNVPGGGLALKVETLMTAAGSD